MNCEICCNIGTNVILVPHNILICFREDIKVFVRKMMNLIINFFQFVIFFW